MSMLREFFAHFADLSPGIVGLEVCQSLFPRLKKKTSVTEKFLARHISSIQQAIASQELGKA